MGDLNINLILDSAPIRYFTNIMQSHHFIPSINRPTRFYSNLHNPSLIDQIWFNTLDNFSSGVIVSDITDHCPCYLKVASFNSEIVDSEKIVVKFRLHNESNISRFRQSLVDFNWNLMVVDDPGLETKLFIEKINYFYRTCFPLKTKHVRKRYKNPWFNSKIFQLIDAKSKYFNLYRMGLVSFEDHKSFRNRVNSIISGMKKKYYRNLFQSCVSDAKKTWSSIRDVLGVDSKSKAIKKLVIGNSEIKTESEICESLNDYLHAIPLKLDSKISRSEGDPCENIFYNENSIFLSPVSASEVESLICNLKNVKQNLDNIPVFLLKIFAKFISRKIGILINKCFSHGIFPDCLKFASIVPIFKSGSPLDLGNYRPISLLPIMSKIFEKCIFERIYSFVTRFSLITPCQFGFLRGLSTQNAIVSLTEYLYETLNSREIAIAVFIDLSKAFDTVNFQILLKKLNYYGIRGKPLQLLENYLCNRTQAVKINNSSSSVKPVTIGVPQGSILGPLLFILYINDLPMISSDFKPLLFADDTTLCFRGSNYENLIALCNRDLEKLVLWSKINRLTINFEKTFYMLFTNKQIYSNPEIRMNNFEISRRRG